MRNFKTLPVLLVLFCLLSSFGNDPKVYKNYSVWLPEGFDSRNNILLVQNFSTGMKGNNNLKKAEDKVTEKMKALVQKVYPYKYEFASADQISTSTKYANTDLYRYVIIDVNGSTPGHLNNNTMPGPNSSSNPNNYSTYHGGQSSGGMSYGTSTNDLYIYDRKLDKAYPPTGHVNGYVEDTMGPMFNTIVKYLKGLTSAPAPVPPGGAH